MSLLVLLAAIVAIIIYENNSKQKIMDSRIFAIGAIIILIAAIPKSRRPIMHLRNVVRAISLRITILTHKP